MVDQILNRSEATTHSAISVVNAIPSGRGVTIGIEIPCRVIVESFRSASAKIKVKSDMADPHGLIVTCVKYTAKALGVKPTELPNITINVESKIPSAVGLKSSSAVSVAVVKAVSELYSDKLDSRSILTISSKASKDSKASLTGAYDDASACLLGGLVFTDNSKFKILRHIKLAQSFGSRVAILIPNRKKLTSSLKGTVFSQYKAESLRAFHFALEGEIAQAMLLNSIVQCVSLGYSIRPVISALGEGATASGVTGKGPAVAALCMSSRKLSRITKRWSEENPDCDILSTKIVQPERLVR